MQVAFYYNNNDIRVEDRPVPKISDREILLKIEASGICGSDLMEWYRVPKAPVVLGHEVTGEIVEVGGKVNKFKRGQRVIVTHHVPCNSCSFCLSDKHTLCESIKSTNFDPGGFSQFLRIPEINVDRGVFLLPGNVSYEEGTFTEPLGCVVRGHRIAEFKTGYDVIIIGGGITGLLNLQYAVSQGAGLTCVVDPNDYKLEAAKEFGADLSLSTDEDIERTFKYKNKGKLADFVVVCTGAESAISKAFDLVEKGGTVLFFAPAEPSFKLSFNYNKWWWSGVSLCNSYAASPSDLRVALKLIENKRVNVKDMITHRLPLTEIEKGFKIVEKSETNLKVIITPNG